VTRDRREEAPEYLFGVHPVAEALETGARRIERILVARELRGSRVGRVLKRARLQGVPVSYLPRQVLSGKVGGRAVHQGIAAQVSGIEYADPGEVIEGSASAGRGVLLLVDRVEDPRNLGAILRSAAAVGVDGVLLALDSTVGVTPTVLKASAGTASRLRIARVSRPARVLETLRSVGYRTVGLDPRGETPWDRADLGGRFVLVVGGEGRGSRRKVLEGCDMKVSVPLEAGVDSLNVSVATGVVLFEALRQRRAAATSGEQP
jgi:23S rRNA (guanosine2251-2'-O)-methyltransferase